MRALLAAEKLSGGFVAAPRLKKPPKGGVVAALWTLYRGRWHCFYFFFLVTQYLDFRARLFGYVCRGRYSRLGLFSKTAFFTEQHRMWLLALEFESGAAFRAELHYRLQSPYSNVFRFLTQKN